MPEPARIAAPPSILAIITELPRLARQLLADVVADVHQLAAALPADAGAQ